MIVSGRVQGVGFRYFVISVASQVGQINGRVWNNDDGTVGIFAQSESSEKLQEFTWLVRQGPKRSPFAKVTYLESTPAAFKDFSDFSVSYQPF
ncbi:acylphosphatase [Lactococcus fujiensis JCM 16395]|uniref:acylphosphatase n=2 Tax=Lactococcus fujiensis TaxID=610251 RepID=A0A2A5RPE3_9LACT|nr:acylphosphatase [Lactococcus fujiensis JCM 16395]